MTAPATVTAKSSAGEHRATTASKRRAQPAKAPGAAAFNGRGARILLVDDDPMVLSLTHEMLTALGYEVITATEAKGALGVVQSEREIDLLLSDVQMPGVSGLGLARAARSLRPNLPVLLTSGYLGAEPVRQSDEFPLLDKPYDTEALAMRLRRLLDPRLREP